MANQVGGVTDAGLNADLPLADLGGVRSAPARGAASDHSGTITTGGTAQSLAAAKSNRCWFFFQNLSSADLWISFDGVAAAAHPSILVQTKTTFKMDSGFVDTRDVSVFGGTTSQEFTCKDA